MKPLSIFSNRVNPLRSWIRQKPGKHLAQVGLMAPGYVEIPMEDWKEIISLSTYWIEPHSQSNFQKQMICYKFKENFDSNGIL